MGIANYKQICKLGSAPQTSNAICALCSAICGYIYGKPSVDSPLSRVLTRFLTVLDSQLCALSWPRKDGNKQQSSKIIWFTLW